MNEKVVKTDKNLYNAKVRGRNRTIMNQDDMNELDFINNKQKTIKLSELNKRINEIREILNEACCTVDTSENINDRLAISQYLDELIVQYMKELNSSK